MSDWLIPLMFFAVAFFYSLVGFGGGSSYLALLSLLLTDFLQIRSMALLLNLLVVGIATFLYIKRNVFDWKLFWPFIAFSMPFAFLGALVPLTQQAFFLILGTCLLISALFLMVQTLKASNKSRSFSWLVRGSVGGLIGFLSGIAGIGGGIFLSPTLNLVGWANPRTVASLASTFIIFNSASGLVGLWTSGALQFDGAFAWPLLAAVAIGGGIGSYFANTQLNTAYIRGITALLVAYVGLRLILRHGFSIMI